MTGFYHPEWLIALVILPALYYYYIHETKRKKQEAIVFSNIGFLKSALHGSSQSSRPRTLLLLILASVGCIIIGLADPHIPLEQAKEGVNVVLVIDVSGSMQANDYQPTRLESAKRSAEILLKSLDIKDYAGVITFETGATSAAYLSPDKDRVIKKLRAIEPKEGATAIGDGLGLGIDMAESIPNKKKVVILLSDGVNNAGVIAPEEAAQFAREKGIQVFTIGMGSESPVVLGYDWFGNPQYAMLDEELLQSIADSTQGKYYKSVDDRTLSEIYKNLNKEINREKEETSIATWFFTLSMVFMVGEVLLRYGRRRIIQ
ncbi:VWA domain-containing protein [Methanospirillum stamsii]|uniref:Aerotolerance regulator BatA n=1 Tax=Methanospirillum stamsii TaxID=1277351 RepID=A0A2V2N5C6_9EURY|nr:VWA domain-containing protein [Methanospirillum stamsii]PWR75019.1 aerotolerance regulator BatA [Methanospirillum stamsii]